MNQRRAEILRTAKQVVTGTADTPEIVDVWSRTKPKYRRRAVVLLLINAVLFVGLGCFTFWLRTGTSYGPLGMRDYGHRLWAAFDPVAEDPVTLADFLLFPISLEDVPLQIVVVGLLLATLTAIPILVAILYRFPLAAVFIAIVAFVALMPWLAITLTISCLIASARPFKFEFRYAYALIALVPVVVYFLVNIMRFGASLPVVTPEQRVKLYAPLVLATLASCVLMALVLLIARIVNYRPGAIAPLLAVMFLVPWGLFHAKIGRDELYYRLLEHDCGPGSRTFFVDRDENDTIREYAQIIYDQDPDPLRDVRAIMDIVKVQILSELLPE